MTYEWVGTGNQHASGKGASGAVLAVQRGRQPGSSGLLRFCLARQSVFMVECGAGVTTNAGTHLPATRAAMPLTG